MSDCRCCNNPFKCECLGMPCQACQQCEIHCECAEEQAYADKLEESKRRDQEHVFSLDQQKKFTDAGLMKSGMKVDEAIFLARNWWDDSGRKKVNREFNYEKVGALFRASNGKSPGIKVSPVDEACLMSGILQGLPWSRLNPREKKSVVECWHETHIMQRYELFKERLRLAVLDPRRKEPAFKIIH